jgi:methionine synthase II (cobalamin-independent)
MSEITSTVYGIAPWSGELLQASGDIERGRAQEEDYTRQLHADFGIYSGVLESAGIDFRSGDWGGGTEDYLRDISRLFNQQSKGKIKSEELTRWFDTNTFYRQPVLKSWPEKAGFYPHAQYQDWLKLTKSDGQYQPTFLSPYAFAKLAGNGEGVGDDQALELTRELYDQLLAEASFSADIDSVLLHEPFIPYSEGSKEERTEFIKLIGEMAAFHEPLKIGLFFGYGDASDVINEVVEADVPVTAIGADLQKTPLSKIGSVGKRTFLAGLVDGANTLFPLDRTLAAQIEGIAVAQDAAKVSLTHTVDLERVPRRYALQKILQIGRVAALVNGGNGQ